MTQSLKQLFAVILVTLSLGGICRAVEPAGNSALSLYQALRNPTVGSEAFDVHELVLTRDAAVFTLHSGTICLLAPVDGIVTGAVFNGKGSISLETDSPSERAQIALLTKDPFVHEEFEKLALRFSDSTADEIRKSSAAKPATGDCKSNAMNDVNGQLRFPVRYNLAARLLQDVLSKDGNGVFYAFIAGQTFSNRMLFAVDPHGVPELLLQSDRSKVPSVNIAPEEVALFTYDERHFGVWFAHHLKAEYAAGTATGTQQNAFVDAVNHVIDVTIEKNGELQGTATTTIRSNAAKLYVVPLNLYETLRVEKVTDASGQTLSFIQEDKNQDPQFSVLLSKPLQAGESLTLVTTYGGKKAVFNEGNSNYYPVARTNWYPNTRMGDYSNYDLTLRVPKGLVTVATGKRLGETVEGDKSVTKWKSEVPLAVAGFTLGGFREKEAKLQGSDLTVATYANEERLSGFSETQGGLETVSGMKRVQDEGMAAAGIYTNVFGPLQYDHIALTQQAAANYGQAWPELVFLPFTVFMDQVTRSEGDVASRYGRWYLSLIPHEVAHQWWGHTVGWNSYRDQWMGEGFADFSASLYLQTALGQDKYLQFWKDQQTTLVERRREGFRAIDVGPLTMGNRLSSAKAGYETYRDLIYPKGSFVLHMIRMMMWTTQDGDKQFSATMHDFLETYRNKPASTEDFERVVEKHITPSMDINRDGKLNWFFDEWVRSTTLPTYAFEYKLDKDTDGTVLLSLKVKQSNVTDDFQMPVPIYLEMPNGGFAKLGNINMKGNNTREGKLRLGKMDTMPKRALINYQYDVLCSQ